MSVEKEDPAYPKYVHQLIDRYEIAIKKKFGFSCIGCGGRMPYDVEMIRIGLNAKQHATIEQARTLFVQSTNELVGMMNADEKLRPFLREYPVDHNRASITISFTKKITGIIRMEVWLLFVKVKEEFTIAVKIRQLVG